MTLRESPVRFDRTTHTYTLDGRELSGITPLLARQLFPDKYDGIPREVLDKAAERGTRIHETIELYDNLGVKTDEVPELKAYAAMMADGGHSAIATEYLVSDERHYASSIDKVFDDLSIADIKTTSSLDMEYVSWQLSIYAFLFERQNTGFRVPHLYAIWLPKERYGNPRMVEVARKPDGEVVKLLEADMNGLQYEPPQEQSDYFAENETLLAEYLSLENEYKARADAIKQNLMKVMSENNIPAYKSSRLTVSYIMPAEKTDFDKARFKDEHPDLYNQYVTTKQTKPSVRVTLAKAK